MRLGCNCSLVGRRLDVAPVHIRDEQRVLGFEEGCGEKGYEMHLADVKNLSRCTSLWTSGFSSTTPTKIWDASMRHSLSSGATLVKTSPLGYSQETQ